MRTFSDPGWLRRLLGTWWGLALVCCLSASVQAGEMPFAKPYSHFSQNEPLSAVLADFARAQGFQATVSEALSGTLSGAFQAQPPGDFLDGLGRAFGVRWYVLGRRAYFYQVDETTDAFIHAQTISAQTLYQLLMDAGVVAAQLPLRMPADPNGFLRVSGSPAYVRRIQSLAEELERSAASKMVLRVFKLKYASADDISMESMGRTLTVPGVASILKAMVTGQNVSTAVTGKAQTTVDRLKGKGLSADAAPNPTSQAQANAAINAAPPAEDGTRPQVGVGQFNIVADSRVNAVVVQDTIGRMPYYERVIADLDHETHLVEIHASIVDVDTNHRRDLGIDWNWTHNDGGTQVGGGVSSGNSGSTADGVSPPASWSSNAGGVLSTIYTHGANTFMARIAALQQNGDAQMLGQPSVLTSDNLEATLENTTTYYIQVAGRQEVDLFKVEAGTVLRVTPHIIENSQGVPAIKLTVTVQDDQENVDAANMVGEMAIPPIKQTKINTQAIIDAGQSLLVGGYYYEKKSDTVNGVPLLMNIPWVGNLFKSTSRESRQMERLILITPKIVRLGEAQALPGAILQGDFSRDPATGKERGTAPPVAGNAASSTPPAVVRSTVP
jgi:type III secretion protein C